MNHWYQENLDYEDIIKRVQKEESDMLKAFKDARIAFEAKHGREVVFDENGQLIEIKKKTD